MSEIRQNVDRHLSALAEKHAILVGVIVATVVAACLLFLLWFVVFSGLSASADFLYAQF